MQTTHTSADDDESVIDESEEDASLEYTYDISSYGADYPVAYLVDRLRKNRILVPRFDRPLPNNTSVVGFQRDFVWPKWKAGRFIESLLLGLPVPGIFLVKETNGRLLVLDGHQRLHSLRAYYDGQLNNRPFVLHKVQEQFENKAYSDLDIEDQRRLDESILHATIIRQDKTTKERRSIYLIFERLNTGGVNLQPQEIRVALFHGRFVNVLAQLNDDVNWRALYGRKSKRLKDMELILRFFAFYYWEEGYRKPMKDFLNNFMSSNVDLEVQSEDELTSVFSRTTKLLAGALGTKAFRPEKVVNAAVVDSVMVAVATRLRDGDITDVDELRRQHKTLLVNKRYLEAIKSGTSGESNVETRMALAKRAFASVR